MSANFGKVSLRLTPVSLQVSRNQKKVHHPQYSPVTVADDNIYLPLLAMILLPYAQSILELVQRCLADDERSDTLTRTAYGLIGDLAECFSGGQLKQLFLSQWVANELRSRARMPDETRKTMRWAREVSFRSVLMLYELQLLKPLCRWSSWLPCRRTFFLFLNSIPFDSFRGSSFYPIYAVDLLILFFCLILSLSSLIQPRMQSTFSV
jgi:hypothetical protein